MAAKELTIEELKTLLTQKEAEITDLKAQVVGANLIIEESKNTLTGKDAEIVSLNESLTEKDTQIDGLKTDLHSKESELNDAATLIGEQQAQLSLEDNFSESVQFTHDKKKYRVKVPVFNVAGVNTTAEQLKDNKILQKQLVDSNSSILELLK